MSPAPPHVPEDPSKIVIGELYSIRKDLLKEVYGVGDSQESSSSPALPESPGPQVPLSAPDLCLPTPSDLTSRAGFDRINFLTAWAELSLKRWAESAPLSPADPAAFDFARFERLTMQLWRLTAVRKSLLGIEATLEARAAEQTPKDEQKVIFLDPRAFDILNEARARAREAAAQEAASEPQATVAAPASDPFVNPVNPVHAPSPAPSPSAAAPQADFQAPCAHYLSGQCDGPCSNCPDYAPIGHEETGHPDPDYLATLDRAAAEYKQSQAAITPELSPSALDMESPSFSQSTPSIDSMGSHSSHSSYSSYSSYSLSVPPSPCPQVSQSPSPHSPAVPACPTISPDRLGRTLARITDDLNISSADTPSPSPITAPDSVAVTDSAAAPPPAPAPPESPWARNARLRFQRMFPHLPPESFSINPANSS